VSYHEALGQPMRVPSLLTLRLQEFH
jgi:hypothetical protein